MGRDAELVVNFALVNRIAGIICRYAEHVFVRLHIVYSAATIATRRRNTLAARRTCPPHYVYLRSTWVLILFTARRTTSFLEPIVSCSFLYLAP